MLPDGLILKLIKKYNTRLLYWAAVMAVLSVFPTIHQVNKPKTVAEWDYLAISILIMIALVNVVKYLIWNSKPVLHPVCKYFRRIGDTEELIADINAAASASGTGTEPRIIAAGSWIIYQGFFKFSLIPLADVVWVYQKISGGSRKNQKGGSIIVFTKDEQVHPMKYGQQNQNPVTEISGLAPWAYYGFTEKNLSRWKNNRREMIAAVEAKIPKTASDNN